MLKLQYELGHSPVNIYTDRPNIFLQHLKDINIQLFIIGQYKGDLPSGYRKISNVTADVIPNIVLSQTKIENFDTLRSVASDYKAIFLHYEMNFLPDKASPKAIKYLKGLRADVNVFTDPHLMDSWEFDGNEGVVIENTADSIKIDKTEKYYISNNLPIAQMANSICPIVFKTSYTSSIITHGVNGFLYSDKSELSFIINRLQKMDSEDLSTIGKNAKKLILERFTKEKFLDSWKKLIRGII